MSVGATAFGLDQELTHYKYYSSEPVVLVPSHVLHRAPQAEDQSHFALLKTLLPAFTAVLLILVEASSHQPHPARHLSQTAAWANHHQEMWPAVNEDIWCGILQPSKSSVSSLGYNIL